MQMDSRHERSRKLAGMDNQRRKRRSIWRKGTIKENSTTRFVDYNSTSEGTRRCLERAFGYNEDRAPTKNPISASQVVNLGDFVCEDVSRKAKIQQVVPPLRSIQAGQLYERWGMDTIGPLPQDHEGNHFVLVFTEYCSRYGGIISAFEKRKCVKM